jgi:hypothetical protein
VRPRKKSLLSVNDGIWVSRYLSSTDNRPVNIRPYHNMRILAAVANPKHLKDRKLAPIDVMNFQIKILVQPSAI